MARNSRIRRTSAGAHVVQISAAQFKARCLELMDRVSGRRQEFIITKHGRPVAKLVPIEEERSPVFGYMKNAVVSYGDLISPVEETWEVETD
ncbi:MAG: type II toxin-antitoxin system prevent-host-death family antitoxin [Acidobacteria bacterium]|nr:MAG: type II toxin-antitoxin system prevent-host-death family antitoxin [Acidobacteriota bacterium]